MQSKATTSFQLINDQLSWCPSLTNHLEKLKTKVISNNYKIVAIMGAQSTGKSTLLNYIFDTNFQVMDSKIERSQTTKGIFVQPITGSTAEEAFLIFDVEGTDSEERSDMGSKFEKMLCTFALVASDVLIINMLTTDVGRNKGSSMQLLKTILQINVKLFKNEIKPKKVIIMLRDFSEEENITEIERKFKKSLQDFLDNIETATEVSLQHIIQYKLITIPHFKFQKDQFNKKIKEIQKSFRDGEIFPKTKPSVPLNGLEKFLENIWKKIKSDETLDVPNEQFLVSKYLCEKAFDESLAEIENEMKKLQTECSKRLFAEEFMKTYNTLKNKALEKFKQQTMYLEKEISEVSQKDLMDMIDSQFREFSSAQIELLIQSIEKDAEKEMKVSNNFQTSEQIIDKSDSIKNSLIDKFQSKIRLYKLKGESATKEEIKQISSRIADLQAPHINKSFKDLENKMKNEEKKREEQRNQEQKKKEEQLIKDKKKKDEEIKKREEELKKKEEQLQKDQKRMEKEVMKLSNGFGNEKVNGKTVQQYDYYSGSPYQQCQQMPVDRSYSNCFPQDSFCNDYSSFIRGLESIQQNPSSNIGVGYLSNNRYNSMFYNKRMPSEESRLDKSMTKTLGGAIQKRRYSRSEI